MTSPHVGGTFVQRIKRDAFGGVGGSLFGGLVHAGFFSVGCRRHRRAFTASGLGLETYGVAAVGLAVTAAENRHVLGVHGGQLRQLHRDHVAGPQMQELADAQVRLQQQRAEAHLGIQHFLLQHFGPAAVAVDAVALHAGIQQGAHRLDHRVRQGQVNFTAAAIELDVEARHHHGLGRADDVGELRIDLRAQVFELQSPAPATTLRSSR